MQPCRGTVSLRLRLISNAAVWNCLWLGRLFFQQQGMLIDLLPAPLALSITAHVFFMQLHLHAKLRLPPPSSDALQDR